MTTPEIIDQIDDVILEDRRISAKSIAEKLSFSRERIGSITHEDLDMRKLSAKCMNADQEVSGASRLSNFRNFFARRDPNDFLSRLVTMDETWLYRYDPETKQQSMEGQHSGSPRPAPKTSECKNPLENF